MDELVLADGGLELFGSSQDRRCLGGEEREEILDLLGLSDLRERERSSVPRDGDAALGAGPGDRQSGQLPHLFHTEGDKSTRVDTKARARVDEEPALDCRVALPQCVEERVVNVDV